MGERATDQGAAGRELVAAMARVELIDPLRVVTLGERTPATVAEVHLHHREVTLGERMADPAVRSDDHAPTLLPHLPAQERIETADQLLILPTDREEALLRHRKTGVLHHVGVGDFFDDGEAASRNLPARAELKAARAFRNDRARADHADRVVLLEGGDESLEQIVGTENRVVIHRGDEIGARERDPTVDRASLTAIADDHQQFEGGKRLALQIGEQDIEETAAHAVSRRNDDRDLRRLGTIPVLEAAHGHPVGIGLNRVVGGDGALGHR